MCHEEVYMLPSGGHHHFNQCSHKSMCYSNYGNRSNGKCFKRQGCHRIETEEVYTDYSGTTSIVLRMRVWKE